MAFQYAGLYETDDAVDLRGRPLAGRSIAIVEVADPESLVTIWADRDRSAPATNPVQVDADGNLMFRAEVGQYYGRLILADDTMSPDLVLITVGPDIAEANADIDAVALQPRARGHRPHPGRRRYRGRSCAVHGRLDRHRGCQPERRDQQRRRRPRQPPRRP